MYGIIGTDYGNGNRRFMEREGTRSKLNSIDKQRISKNKIGLNER